MTIDVAEKRHRDGNFHYRPCAGYLGGREPPGHFPGIDRTRSDMSRQGLEFLDKWLAENITPGVKLSKRFYK